MPIVKSGEKMWIQCGYPAHRRRLCIIFHEVISVYRSAIIVEGTVGAPIRCATHLKQSRHSMVPPFDPADSHSITATIHRAATYTMFKWA